MSAPTFQIDPPARRDPTGWVFLTVLFLMVISLSIATSFMRSGNDKEYTAQESAVHVAMKADSLTKKSLFKEEAIKAALVKIEPDRHVKPFAAAFYAVMQFEEHNPISASDLAPLNSPPTASDTVQLAMRPKYSAIAEIYGSKALTVRRADELMKVLSDDRFLVRMMRAHALEKSGRAKPTLVDTNEGLLFAIAGAAIPVIIFFGMSLWGLYFYLRSKGKFSPLGHPVGMLSRFDSDRFALRGAQFFGAFISVSLIVQIVFSFAGKGLSSEVLNVIATISTLGAFLLIARLKVLGAPISLSDIGISKENLPKNVIWGICGSLALVPVLFTVVLITSPLFKGFPDPDHPLTTLLRHKQDLATLLPAIFLASIMAPLTEEILFRGTLLPALSSAFKSVPKGILTTSFLFAAIHPQGIPAWVGLATIGAMLSLLTYQTKSLVPAMVMHAMHNFGTLVFALVFM